MVSPIVGVVLLAMAAIAGYGYVDTNRRINAIDSRETVSPWQATPGPIAVEGTIAVADVDPIRTPLTGEEAVFVDWEREENPHGEDEGMTTTGQRAVDFGIEDDRGEIRIRPKTPDAVTVSSGARTTEYVHDVDVIDADLREQLEAFDTDSRDTDGWYQQSSAKIAHGLRREDGDMRFIQEALTPGDDCYVVGEAKRDADGELVIETGGDGPFVLSNMGAESLAEHYEGNQTLLLLIVVGLVVAAGYVFAMAAGVI